MPSLFRGTAVALTLFGAVEAGAAVVTSPNVDPRSIPISQSATGLLVEWNDDFTVYANMNDDGADRPYLAPVMPDEPQTSDLAPVADEAVADEGTPDNESVADAGDSSTTVESFSDYCKYKLSQIGGYFGANADVTAPAVQPANDTPATDNGSGDDNSESADADSNSEDPSDAEAGKTDGDSTPDTANKTSDDTNYSQSESDDEGYSKYKSGQFGDRYGENRDVNSEESQSTESAEPSDESTTSEDSVTTEESPENDGSTVSDESTNDGETAQADDSRTDNDGEVADSEDAQSEVSSDEEESPSSSLSQDYRYRYEPTEDRYGENRDASNEDEVAPSDEYSDSTQNGDEDNSSEEEAVADTSETPLVDAMVDVAANWTADMVSSYGLRLTQVLGVIEQFN